MPDPKKPEEVAKAPAAPQATTALTQEQQMAKARADQEAALAKSRAADPQTSAEQSRFVKEKDDTGRTFATPKEAAAKPQRFKMAHAVGNYAKGETVAVDRLIPVDPEWSDARIERAQGEGLERLIGLGAVEPVADEPEPKPE